jgi:PKD domain
VPLDEERAMKRTPAVLAFLGLVSLLGCSDDDNPAAADFTIDCSASPTSGQAPLAVSFTARPTGTTESLVVTVSFGDGTSSVDPSAGHVYTQPGVYTAQFSAQAPNGGTATCSSTITVTAAAPSPSQTPTGNSPPDAVFKTNPIEVGGAITGAAPFEVHFNMCPTVDAERDLLLFTIDLESDGRLEARGTTGADCRRIGIYAAGRYTATLCVTDAASDLQPLHPAQCQRYTVVATP